MSNNFDTSSTGVNLEFSFRFDQHLSQESFTDEVEVYSLNNYRNNNQDDCFKLKVDTEFKDVYSLEAYETTCETLVDAVIDMFCEDDIAETICSLFSAEIVLSSLDIDQLRELLQEMCMLSFCHREIAEEYYERFQAKFVVIPVRGYSQGDYAEVLVTKKYLKENPYLEDGEFLLNLFYGSYLTAGVTIDDGDEMQSSGYDADEIRKDLLQQVKTEVKDHPKAEYIVSWVEAQLEAEPDYN